MNRLLEKLKEIANDTYNKTKEELTDYLQQSEPYQCRVCHQWTLYKTKYTRVCPQCLKKMKENKP